MLEQGFTLASGLIGSMIVDAAWSKLPSGGYLAGLQTSSDLSSAVHDSLLSLRLAGSSADSVQDAHHESTAKGKDIVVLLRCYEEFLSTHKLVDRADLAAVLTFLSPGLRFFHQGEFEGRTKRISPHLSRGPNEPVNRGLCDFYDRLLNILRHEVFRNGQWQPLECTPAWDGNRTPGLHGGCPRPRSGHNGPFWQTCPGHCR
jgi:hypothetical protein